MIKNITRLCGMLVLLACSHAGYAQLTGAKYIPGDYVTISAAVSDLNTNGVGVGGVTFNVAAGYAQTLTAPIAITATGTLGNPIIFQKDPATSGANPVLTAYTGTATPSSTAPDGMWRLMGSDYVTIDGIDLTDAASSNPATMEYGYGLFKASASDGAQNNTIQNCTVSLSRVNNASGTAPMLAGSVGILMINATATAATTVLTPSAAAGANANNVFKANTVKNTNIGIGLVGYNTTGSTALSDVNNIVGGITTSAGNTVTNFGSSSNNTNAAVGISVSNQFSFTVSNNTVNNNTGTGSNHATTLRGIYLIGGTSGSGDVNNNTVTVNGGGTTSSIYAIDMEAGNTAASNTINVNNNTVSNCTYSTATSGVFYGIYLSSSATTLNANGNTIVNNVIPGTGSVYMLYNIGAPVTLNTNSNTITANTKTSTGSLYLLYNGTTLTNWNASFNVIANNVRSVSSSGTTYCVNVATPTNFSFKNNRIESNSFTATGSTGSIYGYYSPSSAANETIWNDTFKNLTTPTSGSLYGVYIGSATGNKNIKNNIVTGYKTGSGTLYGIYMAYGNVDTISGNQIYADTISAGSGSTMYGIYVSAGTTNAVFQNKIYNLSNGGASPILYGLYLAGGTTNNVYNNLIGDLRTPSASAANALTGIYVSSGSNNVFHNTVYLNATSTGTNFGSSALFASTSPTLNLVNNILYNSSTAAGTGLTVAYRRSATSLSTYASTSNNNLFYAGTPGAVNLVYSDGTNNLQTLANYQALSGLAPRDNSSVTENVAFLSTTGTSANFLHVDVTSPTVVESGGNTTFVGNDVDNQVRSGFSGYAGTGTAPDIGADEISGTNPNGCFGTPYTATLSASALQVCNGTAFTISINNVPPGSVGYSYQLQSSPSGAGSWTNAGSPQGGATFTIAAGITAATDYRVIATCVSSATASNGGSLTVNATNCTFDITRSTGVTYTSIASTGSSPSGTYVNGNSTDDNTTDKQPIGFAFPYKGGTYTKFRMCTNGWLTLDSNNTSTAYAPTSRFNSVSKLTLAPFWQDLVCQGNPATAAGLAAGLKYQMIGTAPNRTLIAEWIGAETFNNAGPNLNFQVQLHENGSIDFAYGTMEGFNGTANYTFGYTIGVSSVAGTGTTSADLQSQQAENTNYFAPNSVNNLTIVQECNSALTFTPGNYTGPTSFTPSVPINDDIPGAITLNVNPVPCSSYCGSYYSSRAATASVNSSSCTTAPDDDVWFTFTAPPSGQIKVTVGGSGGYDPSIALYDVSLTAVGSFGCVNATGAGLSEVITATGLNPSGIYFLRISHNGAGSGTDGNFYVCVNDNVPPPINDNICGSISLVVNTSCITTAGSTISATASANAPTGCNTPDDDIWYVFVPNATDNLLTVQSGTGYNASLQIDTAAGGACSGALTQVFCINNTSTGGVETSSGPWVIGRPYFVRVYHAGTGAGSGNFTICAESVPPACVTVSAPAASASVTASGTTISWSATANATGYDIYLSTNQANVASQNIAAQVAVNQPGTSFATGTLSPSTIYYYKIVPQNAIGQKNNGCAVRDFNTNPPSCLTLPTSPVNSGTPCSGTAGTTLSWPASAGATGYNVYLDAGSGPATTLVSANQAGTTYTTGSALAAGTYSWRIVPLNTNGSPTGCPDWTFTVLTSPTVSATPTTGTFCGTGSTTPIALTASGTGTSYVWSPTTGLYTNAAGTTAYSGSSSTTVYANPTATTVYTVTASSSAGCTATATATITVAPAVTVSPTAKFPTLCAGGGADTLYANAGIATSGYCAAVNQGSALITLVTLNTLSSNTSSNQPSALPYYTLYPATGTQTTTLTAGSSYTVGVDLNGAGIVSVWIDYDHDGVLSATEWVQPYINATTGTATIYVPSNAVNGLTRLRVRSRLSANSNGSGDACLAMGSGETEDYDVNITGGLSAGGLTYAWTPTSGLSSSTTANPGATITTTTTYSVTATSAAGCSATDTVRVTVGSSLSATASASAGLICAGAVDTFKAVAAGGGAPYTYSWSNGSTVVSTSARYIANPTVTTTYTVTVTDACSNTAAASVTVTVNPLPAANLSPSAVTSNICVGSVQLLTATTNTGTPAYQFLMNGTVISGATASTYSANASGVYKVIVTNSTTGCFATSNTDTLIVNALPRVYVSPSAANISCGVSAVQLNAQTLGPVTTLLSESFNSGTGSFTPANFSVHTQGAWLNYPSPYTYNSYAFSTYDGSGFVMINSDSNGSGKVQRITLSSAPFATTGYDSVKLIMEQFYQLYSADTVVQVQASTDNATWTSVLDLNALGTHGATSAFAKDTIQLPPAFANQSTVYIRLMYGSSYGWFWAINNLMVTGQSRISASAKWSEATDLYTNSGATTAYTSGSNASTVYAKPSSDIRYIATYSNGICSDTASAIITVNSSPSALAGTAGITVSDSGTLVGSNIVMRDASCNLISTLAPSGGLPLAGNVASFVTADNSVQSYLSLPYATRHYDLIPEQNASTSTATVTLYFTQSEMNAVNGYISSNNLASTILPMPTGPSDAAGIANLRIKQYHGTGTAPGNYTGSTITIKPTAISWNTTNSWWEVTFPVSGFSGFYLTTGRFPTIAVKAYLQGALNSGTTMDNYYQDYFATGSGLMPTTNPYGVPGGTYSQINASTGPAGAIVDWVKVEVRENANPSNVLQTRALLLKTNGSIVDSTGGVPYFDQQSASVVIAVWHRNHLAVMSNSITAPSQDQAKTYDFSTSLSQASNPYGDPQQMVQKNGIWCMWAGDVNNPQDLYIDNSDLFITRAAYQQAPFDVYFTTDINLDGVVDNSDFFLQRQNYQLGLYSTLSNY